MEKNRVMGMMLDESDVQNYQDIFCESQRVFLKCCNSQGEDITRLSGRKEEIDKIRKLVGEEYFEQVVKKQFKMHRLRRKRHGRTSGMIM